MELLVVISIIVLLLAILMPSLQKARELGKRAVCLNNLHQLGLSWMLYTEDNNDKIVSGKTGTHKDYENGFLSASPDYEGWVGWKSTKHYPDAPSTSNESSYGVSIEDQIKEIEEGSLYPYCENFNAYKCPVGRRGNERTYAVVDSMNANEIFANGAYGSRSGYSKKLSQIQRSGERIVFLDCGEQTAHGWTIWPAEPNPAMKWTEPVQLRHGDGTTFAFADGHSEHWVLKHPNTIKLGSMSMYEFIRAYGTWLADSDDVGPSPNEDFMSMQKGIWGYTIDYSR